MDIKKISAAALIAAALVICAVCAAEAEITEAVISNGSTTVTFSGETNGILVGVSRENGTVNGIRTAQPYDGVAVLSGFEADEVYMWESLDNMKPICASAAVTRAAEPSPSEYSGYVVPETTVAAGNGMYWSADDFAAGRYTDTIENNGLYIGAGAGIDANGHNTGLVTVDASNTVIADRSYTKRIKTGGKGDPKTGVRTFYFRVDSDCKLIMDAASSSSKEHRSVIVLHGGITERIIVGEKDAYNAYGIKAGETVIIYSEAGGLNIYGITLAAGDAAKETPPPTPEPKTKAEPLPLNERIVFDSGIGMVYTSESVYGDYLTVYSSGSEMVIDTSSKTINSTKYISRIKPGSRGVIGSDGIPKNKVLGVTPSVDGLLTVDFANGSSNEGTRYLVLRQGDKELKRAVAEGSTETVTVPVEAGTEVYLYSDDRAVNIYGIILEDSHG